MDKNLKIRIISFVFSLFLLALILSSCFSVPQKKMLDEVADLTNAIIHDKPEEAYPFVQSIISEEIFPEKFEIFHDMLKESGGYTLKVVKFTFNQIDGITVYDGIYGLYTYNNGNFVIVASKRTDTIGFTQFKMAPDTENILPDLNE